ncbi:glycoside hydrolase family 20 zincin-like fold domain-containing protein [Portibacter marinus]|uniref:glycoside hydrolase family 20 zincin-like fold domain-containing protein n=1 Tax=Portibacter marinus TaxID=2898660 RepID=UPI001F427C93|nr:glycoside hydrolase family 20 zincin-like fold domain-containing protein [Portibacter marinus]
MRYTFSFCVLATFILLSCNRVYNVSIVNPFQDDRVDFAIEQINASLEKRNGKPDHPNAPSKIKLKLDTSASHLNAEGYDIKIINQEVILTAKDEAGLMYGGLELAEQIKLYGISDIREASSNPYMEMRGPKFNIPLDVRTPSYSDASDAAQSNMPHMWDIEFWKEYLDQLAIYRYNYVTLWSLHPFPTLVKVPGYDNVALDQVLRSTGQWKEMYDLNGPGLDGPEILGDTEILYDLKMEDKIKFWREVMAYGRKRNIDFHFITWNIFDYGTEQKYGITEEIDNDITKDYFRKSVKQMFVTYPDLAGIGLTTGENMKGASPEQKEDWAFDTYAQGVLDAARDMPDRKFTFIHRQHQTGAREIAEKFREVIDQQNIEFLYCFKYAKAHVYSATSQPYHEQANFVEDIQGMKTIWGLRNDDTYYFRWGAPDFVREFIKNIPHEVAKGIYFGSDQWVWGRDFLTKNPTEENQLEIKKHWYQWLMWGRLSYDPEISNERLKDLMSDKFPTIDKDVLFTAWQSASMIYPVTTGFHWGRLDFQWYIEGSKSHPTPAETESGFHDVNRFITLSTHPESGNLSIPEYVTLLKSNSETTLTTPLQVSQKLHLLSKDALNLLAGIEIANDQELEHTINDIRAVAHLGKYYAHKIAGATFLALYREEVGPEYQTKAIEELSKALNQWKTYTELALKYYKNPLWTNRVGFVDWNEITNYVAQDIEIAKQAIARQASSN